ncbi:hypothetical protein [Corynebacterium sp.]|uniref:hypothetical protein n=1 Tax=Corynebacterium sp. TaxID=1720 RepID=UPI0026DC4AFC|nr:hypothetical protein [Corynebacterium sp.]MDO5032880.1 hypothetical protein [Corynebacterium sp.]
MSDRFIYAQFLCEGKSDEGLAQIIHATLVDLGFNPDSYVVGASYPPGNKTVEGGINNILEDGQPDAIFVHRDADNAGVQSRRDEIFEAQAKAKASVSVVPVIPVKETEAWVLWALHNEAFRDKIRGMEGVALPPRKTIEGIAAKEQLQAVHEQWALNRSGKRKNRISFERDRSRWLTLITDVAYLDGCPSYDELRVDCQAII